jgi:hypothetical protein
MGAMKGRTRKTRVMFMHTISDQPATFTPVWNMIHRVPVERLASKTALHIHLAGSVEQIMAERRESRRSLRREHMKAPKYGYVAVVVPV